MGYLEEHLAKGEKLISRAHKTLWIFAREVFMLLLAALSYVIIGVAVGQEMAGLYTAVAFFVLFTFFLIDHSVKFSNTEIILTNTKVAGKSGALTVNVIEIILQNIDCVEIKQSTIGRMTHSGTLKIVTHTKSFTYTAISEPQKFVTLINAQTVKVNANKNKQKKVMVSFGISPDQQKLGIAVSKPQNGGNPIPPQMPQIVKLNNTQLPGDIKK